MWKQFQRTFLTFENTMQIDSKSVCISAGVHFGTCLLLCDNLVSSLNNRLKVQNYRLHLTVWIITFSKVIRDIFNVWNHPRHAN